MTFLSKKDLTEKLILVVQKYPILYDMTSHEFKNSRKKDHLWDTVISHEMNGEKGNRYYENIILIFLIQFNFN